MGAAKVLIIDEHDQYLLLWRGDHPRLPNDPDLPGGTVEAGETNADAAVREVYEEAGIIINQNDIELLYNGLDYSTHGIEYSLYLTKIKTRPEVVISWEHTSYEWLPREAFLKKAKDAADSYMHMVHDVVSNY